MAQKISELAVNIRVDGLPQVDAAAKKVDGTFQKLGAALKSYLGPAALAATAVQFVRIADQATLIEQRLRAAGIAAGDLAKANQTVFNIAQRSAMSLQDTADLYSRIRSATRDLGVTNAQVATATQSIADAFRLGGASAQEAAAAAQQLGQALGAGRLNGDELRSILESSQPLTQAIAREFGVGVGQLRAMGEAGQLTSDRIFRALLGAAVDFRTQVESMPSSVEQSMTRVMNSISRLVGSVDREIGATNFLSRLLNGTSGAIDTAGSLFAQTTAQFGRVLGGSLALAGGNPALAIRSLRGIVSRGGGGVQGSFDPNEFIIGRPRPASSGPITFTPTSGQRGGAIPSGVPGRGTGGVRSTVGALPGGRMSAIGMRPGLSMPGITAPDMTGTLGGVTQAIRASLDSEAVQIRQTLADGIGQAMEQGITAGIERGALSGSIAEGFKALTGTLLGGIGRSMIQFGLATMKIGALMEKIRASLSSFLPGGTIAAGAAMVALGAGFVALGARAAGQSFAGRSGAAVATGAIPSSIIERGTLGIGTPSGFVADGRTPISGTSVRVQERPAVNLTVIGPNDPTAQRGIAEIIRRVNARGGV